MNYTIKVYKNFEEGELILAFLRWQGYEPLILTVDEKLLEITCGRDIPILYCEGEIVAKGFYEVYMEFHSNNLLR